MSEIKQYSVTHIITNMSPVCLSLQMMLNITSIQCAVIKAMKSQECNSAWISADLLVALRKTHGRNYCSAPEGTSEMAGEHAEALD